MKYYVKLPVIPMRKYPKNEAEVVSQAYFSEEVLVFEKEQDWSHIRTVSDKYCGWVETSALHLRDSFFPNSAIIATVERCAAHVYKAEDTIYGPFLTLPFESKLEVPTMPTDPASRWIYVTLVDGSPGYIQRGDVSLQETKKTQEELIEFSKRFLGLPYTWGGRSSFGYDCSGFVQMLYRQMGISIPRDAIDQMHWEEFSKIPISKAQTGDLIFWGRHERAISHVGMYLEKDLFIHATVAENAPYLRISSLSSSCWSENGQFSYRAARTLFL
ncbi:MAG: C40 family peptidase [Rhabdochlamydiaceae bacterium]|nr:C40 family peptidase [Rhabdochlamydiaceae bacterium]